jgi:hypothetical protein
MIEPNLHHRNGPLVQFSRSRRLATAGRGRLNSNAALPHQDARGPGSLREAGVPSPRLAPMTVISPNSQLNP